MITPQEAARLNEEDLKEVSDLEKSIDEQIAKKFGRSGNSVDILMTSRNIFLGPGKKAVSEVLRRYQEAGWETKYVRNPYAGSDPRESDYYVFRQR